jgi:hypothetical protein
MRRPPDLVLVEDGAQGRIRTTDTRIFNPLLYQLSYLGVPPEGRASRPLRRRETAGSAWVIARNRALSSPSWS